MLKTDYREFVMISSGISWEHLGYLEFEVKYICPLCTRRTGIQTECKRSSILSYLSVRQM